VFASESSDGVHRGVFSLTPQKLVDLVGRRIGPDGFEHFEAGAPNAVLECGDYGSFPLCVWADDSTLLILDSLETPQTPDDAAKLAAMVPMIRDAMTNG